ncbi:MAG: 4-hydroxy-3-methylbut-2-enyl diphosphate reductase [Lentisphaerota bacterium]
MNSDKKLGLIAPKETTFSNPIKVGNLEIYLPSVFGFCGGVVHAIKLMEETISTCSSHQIFILGEIIHNNNVNEYFASKGVKIVPHNELETIFSIADSEDVIVIPAFGIDQDLEEKIRAKYKRVIDTTCKDVKRVWKFISSESKNGSTILIHGHPFHPEVEASISRASKNSAVIVIPDMASANILVKHLTDEENKSKIHIIRPDKLNLSKVSMANQTTMLYSETLAIEEVLINAFEAKGSFFTSCKTICKATHMRQTAAEKLLCNKELNLVFVVGGYDSSNTNNLYKLSRSKEHKTFYIRDSSSFDENLVLKHFIPETEEIVQTDLKSLISGAKKIAILAGASCPISLVEGVIRKLSEISKE